MDGKWEDEPAELQALERGRETECSNHSDVEPSPIHC